MGWMLEGVGWLTAGPTCVRRECVSRARLLTLWWIRWAGGDGEGEGYGFVWEEC